MAVAVCVRIGLCLPVFKARTQSCAGGEHCSCVCMMVGQSFQRQRGTTPVEPVENTIFFGSHQELRTHLDLKTPSAVFQVLPSAQSDLYVSELLGKGTYHCYSVGVQHLT